MSPCAPHHAGRWVPGESRRSGSLRPGLAAERGLSSLRLRCGLGLRKPGTPGHYGIYLVDSFGNKELIYRDAQIGCHNPIPLRPTARRR